MKSNLHTYTVIQEKKITLPNVYGSIVCYSLSYIHEYDITFLGHVIKHVKKKEDIPFLFKSIDVIKDYCEYNPKYIKLSLRNELGDVLYKTYKLYRNNETLGYIYWDDRFIKKETNNGIISLNWRIDTPLVDSFAYKVYVPPYSNVCGRDDGFVGWIGSRCNKLNNLIIETLPTISNTTNKWKFELVNEKE